MFLLSRIVFGTMTNKNGRRAPGLPYKIYHPHISPPRNLPATNEAVLSGLVKFIPQGYKLQQLTERVRTGENLGTDWPYNFLPICYWRSRRYNVEHKKIPADLSLAKGVDFYPKLNVWCVNWVEDGRPRYRWFRVQTQGFSRAKMMAEKFRALLEASGRVDNRRTERHIKLQYLTKRKERELRRKRFAPLSKGLF